MSLAMTAPRYDSEAVERVRALITAGVRGRTPAQLGLLAFMAALYPQHIFGVWESGDVDSLGAITVADLNAYRPKIMARDNLRVVVVGDIDGDGAAALVGRAFAALPAKAILTPVPDAATAAARRIDTVAPLTQTAIRFGGSGMKRTDPDFVAASAAAYLLGGRGAGARLYDALVTDHALTAAVSFALNTTDYGGWFAGTINARPADTDAVIALLEQETQRFANGGPTADEVARSQNYLIGSYVGRFDSAPAAATELVNEFAAGLLADYPERYIAAVVSLTPEDVTRAAQRMFAGGMVILTVGPTAHP